MMVSEFGRMVSQKNSFHPKNFHLRPIEPRDCEILWKWANDPLTRSMSISSQTISWHTHVQWFDILIHHPSNSIAFFAYLDEDSLYDQHDRTTGTSSAIGSVRYHINSDQHETVVSLVVNPDFRGLGYGKLILRRSLNDFLSRQNHILSLGLITAYIKPENKASIAVFCHSGFHFVRDTIISGVYLCVYQKSLRH